MANLQKKIEKSKKKRFKNAFFSKNITSYSGLTVTANFCENISQFRVESPKVFREEHRSFLDWFIKIPGIVCTQDSEVLIISAKDYLYRERWERFAHKHKAA
jgi:hypothetical protein